MNKLILIIISLLLSSCSNQKQLTDDEIKGWGTPPSEEQIQEAKFNPEVGIITSQAITDFNNSLKEACKDQKGNNALQKAITDLKDNQNIKAIVYISDSVYIYTKINSEFVYLADSYVRTGKPDLCDDLQ
ncbi:MAG: hypothetical protein GF335_02370 [Candidatus Moranbacteria bacterium]|nr:hypothetical protein [Candidatus Moranbacteria bacterium]